MTMTFRRGSFPSVIAHRGGSLLRPENTVVAFRHAHGLGVRTMETDLHLTRDGELVCHHDAAVDRTTDGRGPIRAHTVRELEALDAGYRFTEDGRSFPHRGGQARIPTLEQALASCPDASFILELKTEGPRMAEAVYAFLRDHEAKERVCVASFHEPTLTAFRALAKGTIRSSAGQTRLALFWALAKVPSLLATTLPFQMMQVPVAHSGLVVVEPRFIEAAHQRHVEVHVWTINDPAEMRRLYALGIDAIITDAPDRAIAVCRETTSR